MVYKVFYNCNIFKIILSLDDANKVADKTAVKTENSSKESVTGINSENIGTGSKKADVSTSDINKSKNIKSEERSNGGTNEPEVDIDSHLGGTHPQHLLRLLSTLHSHLLAYCTHHQFEEVCSIILDERYPFKLLSY